MLAPVRQELGWCSFRRLLAALAVTCLLTNWIDAVAQTSAKTEGEPWVAPARAARKQNPVISDAKSVAKGKELYTAACLPCHGTLGKGDGPAAPSLERNGAPIRPGNLSSPKLWDQPDGALFWKVSEGKSPMPAFQESFNEEQRWQIVNYVRTLAPRDGGKNQEPKTGGK